MSVRRCSKPGCSRSAVSTFTYDYAESTAVLGPLASKSEPHTYDLCEVHAMNLTAPVGWQIVRLQTTFEPAAPSPDDLMALVDAVRLAAQTEHPTGMRGQNITHAQYRKAEVTDNVIPSADVRSPSRRNCVPNVERGPFSARSTVQDKVSKDGAAMDTDGKESGSSLNRHRFQVVDDEQA